jgi:hypothetical protein
MSSPALLGDLGYQINGGFPLNTGTGRYYFKTSGTDTGTILTTSRSIDLSRTLVVGSTGGKPLDPTVHAGAVAAPPAFRGVLLTMPVKIVVKPGGKTGNVYVTVAHKSSTASAGTYVTHRTTVHRWKVGTSTATYFSLVASGFNAQGVKKFYKANITFAFRKGSNTAAKDTTTGFAGFVAFNPSVILSGDDVPSFVPVQVL